MASGQKRRLVVAITGASGAAYGVGLLRELSAARGWESHLVLSEAGALNCWHELRMKRKDVERLAGVAYRPRDVAAPIASGSFLTEGMVIAPCSMKTLSAAAHAHADDLVSRAADVALKERRRLVLLVRETPLNLAHLRNMVAVTEMGGIVFPPVPALYIRPKSVDDLVGHTVGRVLDLFGIVPRNLKRWQGLDA
jgi:polyprenyl P-hydroxybenzoate/phenylacrylic acid decarboxylase-like protein